jgi:lipid-A-disaccharide synthase
MDSARPNPLIYLVVGEASGDLLGARLMSALRAQNPGVRFIGVGGASMIAQGLTSLFPMEELSIMGILEILPHAKRLLGRIKEVARHIEVCDPDVVVTIDAPGFNFRLAKRLRAQKKQRPLVHYTAPSVWAWRPGRAKKIAPLFDHLLTLFPFEPTYFTKHGLATTFVGHPLVEDARLVPLPHRNDALSVCCLVGSRRSEVSRLLPLFAQTLKALKKENPDLQVVCPVLPAFEREVRAAFAPEIKPRLVIGVDEKYKAFQESSAALAASGTVALELALTQTPMIIAYKTNAITAFLVRRLIKTPFACLVNILLKRAVVPEFIQEDANLENLKDALTELLKSNGGTQREILPQVRPYLSPLEGSPSKLAAQVVLSVRGKHER